MKDLWKELEELEKEYKDILDAINKELILPVFLNIVRSDRLGREKRNGIITYQKQKKEEKKKDGSK